MKPSQEDFKAALVALRDVDESQLRDAAAKLPTAIQERLAAGPLKSRWSCGVCEAFGSDYYKDTVASRFDPMWIVWAYHEVPKADMTHKNQLHYGAAANEIYERSLATYRAAGWDGVAPEANA